MHSSQSSAMRRAGLGAVAALLAIAFILLSSQPASLEAGLAPGRAAVAAPGAITETHVLLQKNDGYYGAAGVVITQVTSYYFDQDEAWSRYQAGQLDTIAPPDWALADIRQSAVYSPQLYVSPLPSTYLYGFSTDVPPFDNPLVRAALASAIDRERVIAQAMVGDELPALTLTPPRHVGYVDGDATGIGRPYSPTLAASLLAASGYTGTPAITLLFNDSPTHKAIAEAVRDSWYDTLGISVTLKSLPWPQYLPFLRNGSAEERPGVWRIGWSSDYPDAHNFIKDFMDGLVKPIARYDNATYDALVAAAAAMTNPASRLGLYQQAEATLVETDTVIAPILTYVRRDLTRPDLLRNYYSYGGQHVNEWSQSGAARPIEVAWGSPASLDPARSTDVNYLDQLFLGLTDFDAETGAVAPELATSWEASPDATVYTFTLRGDALWTDANPVTAQDVEYGVLRSLNPATGAPFAYVLYDILNAQEYNEGSVTDPGQVGVEALDATHIRFTLRGPAAYFPVVAGLWPARPQPQWEIEAHGAAWTNPENIVTNGPYMLIEWDQAPHLRIEKSAEGAPFTGSVLTFTIRYWNDGIEAAGCVITDTMSGMTYLGDTSGLSHSGGGSGPIVWNLGTVPAYSSAEFQMTAVITAHYGQTIDNLALIVTDDPNDLGSPEEKRGWWEDKVIGPRVGVDYGQNQASGVYAVGHKFLITVIAGDGITIKATASVSSEPGGSKEDGDWSDGFIAEGDAWSPSQPDIQPGDWVLFTSDDGYSNSVRAGTITGELNAAADTVSGTIAAPWLASQSLEGRAGQWGWWWESFPIELDGSGNAAYLVDFVKDLQPGQAVDVKYLEPDGDYVVNTIQALDLAMRVNYGHDWVEGDYEAGYTVWLTVTDSTGGVKATAAVQTQPVPWWGGRAGFSTNLEENTWVPSQPDIQPGDWVYGYVNRAPGYAGSVRMGTIAGALDIGADTVSGTISAPWFSETLDASCGVWVENGPGKGFQVEPAGGSYFCDFGEMDPAWDLVPGQDVGVQYREPDGDNVINVFRWPAADLRVEKWTEGNGQSMSGGGAVFGLRYRNEGDAASTAVYLTDTLPANTTYVADSSGVAPSFGAGWVAWTLGPLNPGEQRQFYVTLSTTAGAGETLVNKADIWTLYDPQAWNNHGEAQAQVVAGQPDLYVNKNANPGDPAPGQTMLWEIGYGNNGPVASGPVVLTDTLPAGTSIVEWRSENGYALWQDHSAAGQFILAAPSIPGQWGDRILLRLLVDDGVPLGTQMTNTVEIATAGDSVQDNNRQVRDDVWTKPPRWDSMIDKHFGGGRLVPGGEIWYNIHIRNNGNMATHSVLTDTLPLGTLLNRVEECTGPVCVPYPPDVMVGQTAIWDLGIMEPGAWVQLGVRLNIGGGVQAGTVLTNCAGVSIDGPDSRPIDNTGCTVDRVHGPGPDLRIEKRYKWEWQGKVYYEIRFWNVGTTTLNDVKITDTVPINTSFTGNWSHWFKEGIDFSQVGNQLVWSIDRLEPASGAGIRYELALDSGVIGVEGLCYTTTAVAPIAGDVWPADNSDEVVVCTGPDVYAKKWLSGGVPTPGAIVTFTVEFGNKSAWPWDSDDQQPSHITETLPVGMTFVAATEPGNPAGAWVPQSVHGNTIAWEWYPMWADNWWRFDVTVRITNTVAGGQVLTNTVTARGDSGGDVEPFYTNNAFALPVTIIAPVLEVSKAYTSSRVAGAVVTYTLSVTNSGNAAATGAVLSDTLPAGLTYIGSNGAFSGGDVTWSVSSVGAGGGTASRWFAAGLQCQAGQPVVNDTYGVVRTDQGVKAWGGPVTFGIISPTIQLSLAHGPEPALVDHTVYFTATAATDGTPLTYNWDLDGAAPGGLTASHVFSEAGSYPVVITATDACGYAKSALTTVTVEQAEWKTFLPTVLRN